MQRLLGYVREIQQIQLGQLAATLSCVLRLVVCLSINALSSLGPRQILAATTKQQQAQAGRQAGRQAAALLVGAMRLRVRVCRLNAPA